jgi:hypothetical protein
MIRFTCPHCGVTVKTRTGTDGQWAHCECGAKILVPSEQIRALEMRVRETVAPPPAPLDFDEVDLELGIDQVCRKRERTRELADEQRRNAPHPLGLLALVLSLGSGFMLTMAVTSLSVLANAFVAPAVVLAIAGICGGIHAQLLSNRPDERAKAGVWIGGMVLAIVAVIFILSMDRWEHVADAVGKRQ